MAASPFGPWRPGGFLAGWRGLRRFWVLVLVVVGAGVAVIEMLGPQAPVQVAAVAPVSHTASPPAKPAPRDVKPTPPRVEAHSTPQPKPPAVRPGRATAGPITDPDPALLEPYPGGKNLSLPRISDDGRVPMATYAAGFDPSNLRPRVGIVIAGIGMSDAASLAAIKDLPEGVTLAISPYAADVDHLLAVARITEHEYLLSIPMEPDGYPVSDPDGRHALMTALPPTENMDRLRWVLSRFNGYVGVTNALGQMHGERLSDLPSQLDPVLDEVAHRGLLFVDARTGKPLLADAWNRSVDVQIDAGSVDATVLDQRLDALTQIALEKRSALGLVSVPRPMTLSHLAAWINTLAEKGVALAPVSALVQPPAK
ncbi:MAG TPA: divergent polysaccharide deacetylase family protein [Rhodopila sp.]